MGVLLLGVCGISLEKMGQKDGLQMFFLFGGCDVLAEARVGCGGRAAGKCVRESQGAFWVKVAVWVKAPWLFRVYVGDESSYPVI